MEIQVRVDEHNKSVAQIEQREATYAAAKILKAHGIKCEVREYFTGEDRLADAAGIFLEIDITRSHIQK